MGTVRPQGAGYDRGAWEYLASPPLMIVTMSLPDGMLNEPYDATLVAVGGTPPYSWAIGTGSLPPGLTLSPDSGVISGAPSQVGGETFEARVADQVGGTDARELTLVVRGGTIVVPGADAGSDEDGGCGCRLAGLRRSTRLGGATGWLCTGVALLLCVRQRWTRSTREASRGPAGWRGGVVRSTPRSPAA